MLELVAGALVAIVALVVVLEPLVRGAPADDAADAAAALEEAALTPAEESASPKVQALLALKEIEFDRATGKLADEDYAQLRATYAARALDAIKAEEAAVAAAAVAAPAADTDDPVEELIRQARAHVRTCPSCGPRPEADAAFCSNCGSRLA